MGWKDKPYWLKGGIVFGILGFLYIWSVAIYKSIIYLNTHTSWACLQFDWSGRCSFNEFITSGAHWSVSIIFLFGGLLTGSLIGHIYEKIKNRNQ